MSNQLCEAFLAEWEKMSCAHNLRPRVVRARNLRRCQLSATVRYGNATLAEAPFEQYALRYDCYTRLLYCYIMTKLLYKEKETLLTTSVKASHTFCFVQNQFIWE